MRRRFFLAWLTGVALLAGLALAVGSPAAASPRAPQQRDQPAGDPIIIRWSTETEVNTAGFNVYRALAEEGPWEQINSRLIPGSPDPLRGGSYVFTDTQVIAGVTYWYELEEVELSGQATRLERTTATAQRSGLLSGLQCASGLGLLLSLSAGMVLTGRRRRPTGAPSGDLP